MAAKTGRVKTVATKKEGIGKSGKPYKILSVVMEDGSVGETFDDVKEGVEYTFDVTPNGQYADKWSLPKSGNAKSNFSPRPANNRLEAMKLSVQLCCAGTIKPDQLNASSDKILQYITA